MTLVWSAVVTISLSRTASENSNFYTPPVFEASVAWGGPLKFGSEIRSQKTIMMGSSEGVRILTMRFTQYEILTDGRTNRWNFHNNTARCSRE